MSPETELAAGVGRAYAEIGGQPADPEIGWLGEAVADVLGLAAPARRPLRRRLAEWARDRLRRLVRR